MGYAVIGDGDNYTDNCAFPLLKILTNVQPIAMIVISMPSALIPKDRTIARVTMVMLETESIVKVHKFYLKFLYLTECTYFEYKFCFYNSWLNQISTKSLNTRVGKC